MLGIFDSGVGGLSVLKVLLEKTPCINVVYFGDIKNAPYGIKTQAELKKLTANGVKILLENGATNVLSACNSISTFMIIDDLKNLSEKSFGIVEMINPTVEEFSSKKYGFLKSSQKPKPTARHSKIAVFATPATIEAAAYQKGFKKNGVGVETFTIPELAGAIELGKSDIEIEEIIERAVSKSLSRDFERALLCCTHYPFHKEKFEKTFSKYGKKVSVHDPSEPVADSVIKKFKLQEPGSLPGARLLGKGKIKFLISQDSPTFRKMVEENFSEYNYLIDIL